MEALNKKLDRLNNETSITTGFKLQCLNTTLKFIKNDTQLMKEYNHLTPPQAELITTLICNANVNSDIGFGFKSFYAPLWEALKVFGFKYEFKIRELDSAGGKKCLILEKIVKNGSMENINTKPTPMDTSESDISFRSDTSAGKRRIRKTDGILKSLTTEFVRTSLDKITAFYNDDAMASVTFNGLNNDESFFLFNFKNVMSSKRMRSAFEKQVRILFENVINIARSKDNYKLSVKKMKMCDKSNIAITFTKVPAFKPYSSWVNEMDKKENTPRNSSSDRSVSRERGNIKIRFNAKAKSVKGDTDSSATGIMNKSVNSPTLKVFRSPPSLSRHAMSLNSVQDIKSSSTHVNGKVNKADVKGDTDSVVNTFTASVDNPTEHRARERSKNVILPFKNNMAVNKPTNKSRGTSVRSDQSTDRSFSKDRRPKGICFHPGGVLDPHRSQTIDTSNDKTTDNTIDKEEPNHRERPRSGVDLNHRKVKLLEAMSVPIQSDKGLRMMRGMGWEGGALGLRGEGITEPLIPALGRVAWAGLGHVEPAQARPRRPGDFRADLLRALLQLLGSDCTHKFLTYQLELVKKERNFLTQTIQSFRGRSRMELVDEEMLLYNNILQLLKGNPNLILRGWVTPCKRQIHLSKAEKNSPPNLDIHPGDVAILNRMAKIKEKLKRVLGEDVKYMMATLENDCQSKKSYDLLEFKIDILIHMVGFFKANEMKMTWCSRDNLNKKKINYIHYAMESIDVGARFGSTEAEVALVKEVLRLAGDSGLEYTFFNQFKSFTVTKVHKPKNRKVINNNSHDSINKNKITTNKEDVFKNTDSTAKPDIDNHSMGRNSRSEPTEEPVSSSDDVIIIEGKESPIIISDDENYLLGSPRVNWDDDFEETTAPETAEYETKNNTVNDTEKSMDFEVEKTIIYDTGEIMEYEAENTVNYNIKNTRVHDTGKITGSETKAMDFESDNTIVNVNQTENNTDMEIEKTVVYEPGNTTDSANTKDCGTERTAFNVIEKTVPDLDVSEKCDNFDNDLKELEIAIKESDEIKIEVTSPPSKRSRSESPYSDIKLPKLTKLETKKVYIVHNNHPIDRLTKVNIQNLQELISCYILKSKKLPLLKCHGVQDGALVYSCHTEQSYDWLKNTISVASDMTILETKEVIEDAYKMSLKFNCYFEFEVDYLFEMLELYNNDLSTSKWLVLKHNIFLDHVCFVVKMDISSYYYVRNSGYSLYAGVDEVQFSIIWD